MTATDAVRSWVDSAYSRYVAPIRPKGTNATDAKAFDVSVDVDKDGVDIKASKGPSTTTTLIVVAVVGFFLLLFTKKRKRR